jgi:hypothetical protein
MGRLCDGPGGNQRSERGLFERESIRAGNTSMACATRPLNTPSSPASIFFNSATCGWSFQLVIQSHRDARRHSYYSLSVVVHYNLSAALSRTHSALVWSGAVLTAISRA